ncbi:MAG: ABC transporter permease [Gemmatimonadota bacterium]
MDALLQDIRYSLRRLLRAPGFALIAIATLGLGIGANTAIFSVINGVLLKPPKGVSDPDRLVAIFTSDFSGPLYRSSSYPDYQDFALQRDVFSSVSALSTQPVNVARGTQLARLNAEIVSGNYFQLVGAQPAAGRLFTPADSAEAVVVLSESVWRTQFGGQAALIGSTVAVNGRPFTVIGVAAPRFAGITAGVRVEAWLPIHASTYIDGDVSNRDSRGWNVFARLQPAVSVTAAQARLHVLQRNLFQAYPDMWRDVTGAGRTLSVLSERDARVPPDQRGTVITLAAVLLGAVAFVLLICCANIANLLLARASAREREIAIRFSLGARRLVVIRQLLFESLLLAVAGGVFGMLLALWSADLIASWRPANGLPLDFDVSTDGRVLIFTALISLATGLLFGFAPAWQTSQASLTGMLKGERTLGHSRQRGRLRDGLVAAQIAIALVLTVGAGLLVRTIRNASEVDAGFDPSNTVVALLDLETQGYDEAKSREFHRAFREQMEAVPGVEAVTLARRVPLAHPGGRRGVRIDGYTPQPGEDMEFPFNIVSANYFSTMRLSIAKGRAFSDADRPGAPLVVIVNETFANRFWPGQDPVGKQMSMGRTLLQVVGVARNGKYWQIDEAPRPYFYLPAEQQFGGLLPHVKARGNVAGIEEAVRAAVRSLDPQLPILSLSTMESMMSVAVGPQRIAGTLVGLFAALAVLLAGIGVYGVTSVLVAQRVPEIGLRVALGAGTSDVMRLIVGRAMFVSAAGIIAGFAISAIATRGLTSMLYGVSRFDPLTFVIAATVLALAALLAGYIPARRAARVDPIVALKN